MREQLANGPKAGSQIETAVKATDIPERSLIMAADMLGVRTQKGQWYDDGKRFADTLAHTLGLYAVPAGPRATKVGPRRCSVTKPCPA